ncbi:MAG: ABC transporter substrate-binding protein [Candidatus Woesearchaeota archaeon]
MNKKKSVFIAAAILFMVLLGVAFIIFNSQNKTVQNVSVKLKWLHQAQFSGIYVGLEKGFYEKRGLNVTIYEYNEEDIAEAVANGIYDFGIIGADELIIARSKGLKIKAVAVIYKTNPSCAYTLNKDIKNPQQFKNKTIGIMKKINIENAFHLMIDNIGINRSEIKEKYIDSDSEWLENEFIDVFAGHIINEPVFLKEEHTFKRFLFSDYGADIYGDVIITSDENILNNPEIVFSFVSGTIDGWNYAYSNKEEALEILKKYVPVGRYDFNHQKLILEESIPLIFYHDLPVGMMDLDRWEHTQELLIKSGIIKENTADYFTNEFVEKYYENMYKK